MKPFAWTIAVALLLAACEPVVDESVPTAVRQPSAVLLEDRRHIDPYAYLGDTGDAKTIRYLDAEQQYTNRIIADWDADRRLLERELNASLPAARRSAPVEVDGWQYFREIAAGAQYPSYYRQRTATDEPQLLLDTQAAAAGSPFYSLGGFAVSTDDNLIAYTEDRSGAQRYTLNVGELQGDRGTLYTVMNVGPTLAWWQGQLVFVDPTVRQVTALNVETGATASLYQESAEDSVLSVRLSADRSRLVIESLSPVRTHLLQVNAAWEVNPIAAPAAGHHYRVRLYGDRAYVLTNFRNPDFDLALALPGQVDPASWRYLPSVSGSIQGFEVSAAGLVIKHRRQGRDVISLVNEASGETRMLVHASPAEQLALVSLRGSMLSYEREGLLRPAGRYQYDIAQMLPVNYGTEDADSRIATTRSYTMTASDGVDVPITVLLPTRSADDPVPMLVTAYGAYGISFPFNHDPALRLLLKRGVGFAVIHVRGGGELGANWHIAGRGANKQRGVTDLLEATRFLVDHGLADAGKLAVRGASAGATLVAAAMNQAPALYQAAVLKVPYLDLVNSLLDDNHLLTAADRGEWGDPYETQGYDQLKALSPYDNITAQTYPHTLLLPARQDQRVSYTEALKWLARVRAAGSSSLKMLYLEESAGHGGSSDQYQRRRRDSLEHVFLLKMLDVPVMN